MPGRMLAGIFNEPLLRLTCGHLATGRIDPTVLNKDMQLSSTTSVEGMRHILLDRHFRARSCEKWNESIDEMQSDLDDYLVSYNTNRPIKDAT